MIIAIENFKQIMSRPAPDNEEKNGKLYLNPLVPEKAIKGRGGMEFIATNMTIFAQFDTTISKALLELKKVTENEKENFF